MRAKRLHDRSGTEVGGDTEQARERAIGQFDSTGLIQQEQSFGHAVEKGLLFGLNGQRCLLLCPLKLFDPHFGAVAGLEEFGAPPKMQCDTGGNGKKSYYGPEHVGETRKGGNKRPKS
jgi:hypothetical protein